MQKSNCLERHPKNGTRSVDLLPQGVALEFRCTECNDNNKSNQTDTSQCYYNYATQITHGGKMEEKWRGAPNKASSLKGNHFLVPCGRPIVTVYTAALHWSSIFNPERRYDSVV